MSKSAAFAVKKERQTASLLPEYIKESDRAIIEKLLNLSEFKNAETVFFVLQCRPRGFNDGAH